MVETEEFVEMTDGFSLFVRHWTPTCDAEKAILCIHGFGGHSGGFRIFGESLATWGVDVYALDLRGFGNSKEIDLPRGDTKDVKKHLQDLYEAITICRSRHCRKFYVLGHSLGALYTLWIGANYPESSNGLILAAPAVEVKPRISEETRDKFRTLFDGAPETMIETRAVAPPDPLRTTQFSVRYLLGLSSALMGENIFRNAAKLKKPTLIVHGEADIEAAPSGSKRLFEAITFEDKTLRLLPGVDHFLWGSKEQVCSAIMDWLSTH